MGIWSVIEFEAGKYANLMRWLSDNWGYNPATGSRRNIVSRNDFIDWCMDVIRGVFDESDIRISVALRQVYAERQPIEWDKYLKDLHAERERKGYGEYKAKSGKVYQMVKWIAIIPVHRKDGKTYTLYYDTKEKKPIKTVNALQVIGGM